MSPDLMERSPSSEALSTRQWQPLDPASPRNRRRHFYSDSTSAGRLEAVLSSQIEGTQSTLEDVLEFEAESPREERPKDVEEVVNYVRAMNHGLPRLKELPVCLRLIHEIHGELLEGVRGAERTAGEFRRSQNWIGPAGCGLNTASFVPPPVHEMHAALDNLEKFMHSAESMPRLIHCGLAHAQFETIPPFLDGNGRVGRLLITFLLCQQGILQRPLLYLIYYLKAHRAQCYDRLDAVRQDGDWEGWLKFFLRGVHEVSRSATDTARAMLHLREEHRQKTADLGASGAAASRLLDYLFEQPIVSVRMVERTLGCSYVTAGNAGNAADDTGYGAVGYNYRIGTFEVSENQWDAVSSIAGDLLADPGYWTGNQPVAAISWHEADMFTNWLTSSDVTRGVYTIDASAVVTGIDRALAQSTYGTIYFLPTEDEWYKAAYYDPNKGGADVGGYWDYPTMDEPRNAITPPRLHRHGPVLAT